MNDNIANAPRVLRRYRNLLTWFTPHLDGFPEIRRFTVSDRLVEGARNYTSQGAVHKRNLRLGRVHHPLGRTLWLNMALAISMPLTSGEPAVAETSKLPSCGSRPGEGPEMVPIEDGSFVMGSPPSEQGRSDDEGPQHRVTVVTPFALSRCEVTVGEFRAFEDETGYRTDPNKVRACWYGDAEDSHPVACVSWHDARHYAAWISARSGHSYRLPTEAEWEYAARAGTQASRFWGDRLDNACSFANVADRTAQERFQWPDYRVHSCNDGAAFTAQVGHYRSNSFQLHDMMGNVWEWVQDCWHESYEGAPVDGSAWEEGEGGDCTRRVVRGGGWDSGPGDLRSANRFTFRAYEAKRGIGFRLARDSDPPHRSQLPPYTRGEGLDITAIRP